MQCGSESEELIDVHWTLIRLKFRNAQHQMSESQNRSLGFFWRKLGQSCDTQRHTHTYMQGGIQLPKRGCLQPLEMPQGFGDVCTGMANMMENLLGEQPGHPRASQVAPSNCV